MVVKEINLVIHLIHDHLLNSLSNQQVQPIQQVQHVQMAQQLQQLQQLQQQTPQAQIGQQMQQVPPPSAQQLQQVHQMGQGHIHQGHQMVSPPHIYQAAHHQHVRMQGHQGHGHVHGHGHKSSRKKKVNDDDEVTDLRTDITFNFLKNTLDIPNNDTYKRVGKLGLTIIVVSTIACLFEYINHDFLDYKFSTNDINAWCSFFSCFGVIYGIITGFLLNNVLNRFRELSESIENDVLAIQRAFDTVRYLLKTTENTTTTRIMNANSPSTSISSMSGSHNNINRLPSLNNTLGIHMHMHMKRSVSAINTLLPESQILMELYNYTIHLKEQEWVQMSKFDPDNCLMDPNFCRKIVKIYKSLRIFMEYFDKKQEKHSNKLYLYNIQSIIESINNISKYRTNRIRISNEKIPLRLKYLTILMSIFCLFGFILMRVENVYINYFMVIAVTTNFVWLFDVINDLDHPFFGVWNISDDCIKNLIVQFEKKVPFLEKTKQNKMKYLFDTNPCHHQVSFRNGPGIIKLNENKTSGTNSKTFLKVNVKNGDTGYTSLDNRDNAARVRKT